MRSTRRRPAAILAAACLLVLVACDAHITTPPGEGVVRYRDQVFTNVTVTSGLSYGSAVNSGGQTQDLKLDLYQPTGDTVTKRPAIVWVHGGSFRTGTRTSPEIVDQATVFSKKGFVNVSISYRLDPTGCSAANPGASCITAMRNAKEDAQAAVRWLRANATTYGIDTTRIAIGGSSAGAITALHVGSDEDVPGSSGNPGYPSNVRAAVSLSGARLFGVPEADDAWVLMFHGTSDVVVPYASAVSTADVLEAAGVQVSRRDWAGAGHVPYAANRTQILTETTNFLWWSMNLGYAAT
jgi:acetyl esterase/lipase